MFSCQQLLGGFDMETPPDGTVIENALPSSRSVAPPHIDDLLTLTEEQNASDLHIKVGSSPVLRVCGQLVPQTQIAPLREADMTRLYRQVTVEEQRIRFEREKEIDLSYALDQVARFRINIGFQRGTLTMVVHRIPLQIPALDDLRLPSVCKELIMKQRGLILVTGPTGCGKSTTLASMVDYLNERRGVRIVTCEDPVEYVFEDKRALITQREVGRDTLSLEEAIAHALRQDPDLLLVSDLCDTETIQAALQAAENGHLVLCAYNTPDAASTIERIVGTFPASRQHQVRTILANVLLGILSQVLLPTRSDQGQIAAVEVLLATQTVRNLISEGKTQQLRGVIETSQRTGMRTLSQALLDLYRRGAVSLESVLAQASDPERFRAQAQARPASIR